MKKHTIESWGVRVSVAAVLTLFYFFWTHNRNITDLAVIFLLALIVAWGFVTPQTFPRLTPKRLAYSLVYILYLFKEIIKANLDVARRVIQPRIPINPGIVEVRTRLKSPIGRMILANSITLTPGTLSVDIKGDHLFIHWIDVTDIDEQKATEKIVAGFEKYLEVIFG